MVSPTQDQQLTKAPRLGRRSNSVNDNWRPFRHTFSSAFKQNSELHRRTIVDWFQSMLGTSTLSVEKDLSARGSARGRSKIPHFLLQSNKKMPFFLDVCQKKNALHVYFTGFLPFFDSFPSIPAAKARRPGETPMFKWARPLEAAKSQGLRLDILFFCDLVILVAEIFSDF